jgi:hypothetical protein
MCYRLGKLAFDGGEVLYYQSMDLESPNEPYVARRTKLASHSLRTVMTLFFLKARYIVLKQADFDVDAAGSLQDFQDCIARATTPYRLLLLGHSIPAPARARIVASVADSSTLIYQIPELIPPSELISDLRDLLLEVYKP